MPRSRSSSSTDRPLLEVGRIGRPHGLRGEVAVSLITNRIERLAPGSVLVSDRGELVVRSSRQHQQGHLVVFEGVHDRDAAATLTGSILRAEPIEDPDEMWVHDMIGCIVVDQRGVDRGKIVGVIENPASDLLELADGALVPARFVVAMPPGGPIEVEAPDGLFADGEGDTGEDHP